MEKQETTRVLLVITPSQKKELEVIARKEQRTLSAQLRVMLEKAAKEYNSSKE